MRCAYQCHEIGGPYIAENPDCPEHGAAGQARREEEEAERSTVAQLLQQVEDLQDKVKALDARLSAVEKQAIRFGVPEKDLSVRYR